MKNPTISFLFPTVILNGELNRLFTENELNFVNCHSSKTTENNGNLISINKYILNEIEMQDLKAICLEYLKYYLKEIYKAKEDIEIYITQSWINYSKKNEWHHKHNHQNSFLSGVLYINTNETDQIKFYNGKYNGIEIEPKFFDQINSKSWWIPVKNGDLLIFPSSLEHEVPKVLGDKQRISVAFNSFIKGNLGSLSHSTELKL
jgi:uncharacterized protein (TIGR02466 family)